MTSAIHNYSVFIEHDNTIIWLDNKQTIEHINMIITYI